MNQYKEKYFKYIFNSSLFLKKSDFNFNSYPSFCITNMIRKLNIYCDCKWGDIDCHKIKNDKIKNHIYYNTSIWILKITNIERMLFVFMKGICHPIGYDKYHFIYSTKTNINNVNVNQLKYHLYHALRNLIDNTFAENIINNLIENRTSLNEKTRIIQNIENFLKKIKKSFHIKYPEIKKTIIKIIEKYLTQ